MKALTQLQRAAQQDDIAAALQVNAHHRQGITCFDVMQTDMADTAANGFGPL